MLGLVELSWMDCERTGVMLANGQHIAADLVVSNGDVHNTWADLVPQQVDRSLMTQRLDKMRYSMSLVVIYFGTNRTYRDDPTNRLAHHNIILGPRYEELLRDIFDRKLLADDFSLYLHMPTLTDPSLAPPGGEAFYVLAPVPAFGRRYRLGGCWSALSGPHYCVPRRTLSCPGCKRRSSPNT